MADPPFLPVRGERRAHREPCHWSCPVPCSGADLPRYQNMPSRRARNSSCPVLNGGSSQNPTFGAEPYIREGTFSSAQLAELCGVGSSAVRKWRQRLRSQGSLEATVTAGRSRRLTDADLAEVIGLLQAGPDPDQFPDQRWTCPRIRAVIGLKFDVWYHVDHLSRLLHAWGFSRQKPVKRAAEQDQDAVAAWIDTMVPELERKIEAGETLAFLDEVGFSLKPHRDAHVGTVWAPSGAGGQDQLAEGLDDWGDHDHRPVLAAHPPGRHQRHAGHRVPDAPPATREGETHRAARQCEHPQDEGR